MSDTDRLIPLISFLDVPPFRSLLFSSSLRRNNKNCYTEFVTRAFRNKEHWSLD